VEQHDNIVELIDEKGETVEFEYLMSLDYEDEEYILLRPLNNDDESEFDEVVILKVEQDENGDDVYVSIEDEEKANELLDVFNQIIDEI